ncbi:DUF421 domain-containing protein [Desertibacillus haloalkaliphilus]|uniref:DUF421 domain-containing protein n=1 Tax=Desertibacillus haloalkaliphilus TaxID=1328930 RepID=UPI001C274484|nr:DUF421 domain-containing protein [Desertibacillus haloalkaliphilus]MBU8906875.1 DUF421 domain-containing protein [Desertibacillus haloalkaliphilus]
MEESWVIVVRAVIAFFSLLIFTRLLGKQQMGNLSYFDYINGITIGSIAANLATNLTGKAWVHWIGLLVFILLSLALQWITLKSRYLHKIIDAEPVVVVQGGKILEQNLSKVRVKSDELLTLLRQKGCFDLTRVEYAILETNGKLSILPKSKYQSLTPDDLNIEGSIVGLTTEVIIDGIILSQNLRQRKKSKQWLMQELHTKRIYDLKEVSFAAILPNNQLYVDTFADRVNDEANMSDYEGPF